MQPIHMTTTTHWYQRYSPRTLAGRRMITGYIFISPFILGFSDLVLGPGRGRPVADGA